MVLRVKVRVDTDLVQDVLTIALADKLEKEIASGPAENQKEKPSRIKDLVGMVHERYNRWHAFNIYEFEVRNEKGELADPDMTVESLVKSLPPHEPCLATETKASKDRREEERLKEEAEKRKREEEARIKEELRLSRIAELTAIGTCWTLENNSAYIDVPLEFDGLIARNKGSLDQWCSVHTLIPIPARGQYYFAMKVTRMPETTNTWRMCMGVVPLTFKINHERRWIGSQKSWSYIAGTGGKCHDSGKSVEYGAEWSQNDVIGIFLDFDKCEIEFYKNGDSQGVAFSNLSGPVCIGVSLTAKDSEVTIVDEMPPRMRVIMDSYARDEKKRKARWAKLIDATERERLFAHITELHINCWDASFSALKDDKINYPDEDLFRAVNEGSLDKWRTCRSLGSYKSGVKFVQIVIEHDPKTVNSWKFCVGVVPSSFSCDNVRGWVGAQGSWAYIAGTGGKVNNSGQSTPYGDTFGQDDVIGILLNFDKKTIEFFKNGISQGIAFHNLESDVPIHAAVSMTATGAAVIIREGDGISVEKYKLEAINREKSLAKIISDFGNVWDSSKLSKDMIIESQGSCVRNTGSKDKWRACSGLLHYSSGRRYFEVVVVECPNSSNSWKICIGVVLKKFDYGHRKLWVGAQTSWGYIAGTGGKGYDSGSSTAYGSKFGKNDRIGVLMDFDNSTLEFFKNGVSQGIAFTNLKGPVFPAVSLTGKNSVVRLDALCESQQDMIERLFLYR